MALESRIKPASALGDGTRGPTKLSKYPSCRNIFHTRATAREDAVLTSHPEVPALSVNYHISRTSDILSLDEAMEGLSLLHEAGVRKVNFAGGEPFLHPTFLGRLCQHSHELGMNVSIITNGSQTSPRWMDQYGPYVDIMGVSVDSFDEVTNRRIGRGNGSHISNVYLLSYLCAERGIKFKLNTVVNIHNWEEDMNGPIQELNPYRWKVFQVLLLEGENTGGDYSLRDARELTISTQQYQKFLLRHHRQTSLVPEDNSVMQNSYLILDEKMRFLDCRHGSKVPTESILKVGVKQALINSGFDQEKFLERGAIYDWGRDVFV